MKVGLPLEASRWKGRQMCPHLTDFIDSLGARADCAMNRAMLGF